MAEISDASSRSPVALWTQANAHAEQLQLFCCLGIGSLGSQLTLLGVPLLPPLTELWRLVDPVGVFPGGWDLWRRGRLPESPLQLSVPQSARLEPGLSMLAVVGVAGSVRPLA